MHISFLTPEYPHSLSGPSGGLGTSIKNLAETLVNKNVEVSVVIYGQSQAAEFDENGIHFYFLKNQRYAIGGWYFHRRYIQKFLNQIIKQKDIDLIEATDWIGITAFIKLNCPLVIRLNGSDAYFCKLEGRPQKFKNRLFEKIALKKADSLVSVSRFTAEKTSSVFGINRKYEIIPNSIELRSFSVSNRNEKTNSILYFGTIIRKKGVLELAYIFNEVIKHKPEAELIMVGKDVKDVREHESTIELFKRILSSEALKRFSYQGAVAYEKITEYIEKASVVVLPSLAEALPMTWLEAMAMEKALVTSNIGWAKEVMVNGETGYMVNPIKHLEYADRIIQLIEDPELRSVFGKNARQKVLEEFNADVVANRNIVFYKSVLKLSGN
ncbi:glycosyltransferase family 4 protein [Gramella sp. AN32]|uniref:Glycosyltransferase family 4 protein n=1 Tax=Christiangramia antarctica TaxID=2058158 RepID=A0ABW5X7M6_9FLAO|nr:glycosyltransferase family 4 protein [Gramella sp. AN32]MCM4154686.1 glycosyltransferase family 1 protein [Gramella sp. AN32]